MGTLLESHSEKACIRLLDHTEVGHNTKMRQSYPKAHSMLTINEKEGLQEKKKCFLDAHIYNDADVYSGN